jgi:hypothetical protein
MRPENLSRASWLVIAVLIGAAIAWLQVNWTQLDVSQTHSSVDFERLLMRAPVKEGYPWVKSITVYPPMQASFVVKSTRGDYSPRKSRVNFQVLQQVKGGWTYRSAVLLADDPYQPSFGRATNPQMQIEDYLGEVAKNRAWVKFQYAWWRVPMWCYTLWIASSVLVIGIIWPIVLHRLVLAGYSRPEVEEKKESIWSRMFGGKSASSSKDKQAKTAPSMELSADELERIAQMEADLKGFGGGEPRPGEQTSQAEEPVKKLETAPLESLAEPAKPEEKKDYGGEFYPTVAHGKKKSE